MVGDDKMGMFDDIIVPKSYLKNLLTKKQEKLMKDNSYQTKSLENFLGQYKIHRQKLYLKRGGVFQPDKKGKAKWDFIPHTGSVDFYDSVKDDSGNTWWIEFSFLFREGVLDSRRIVKFEILATAEEEEEREKKDKEFNFRRKMFQRTLKYRFFSKVSLILTKIMTWVANQTRMPDAKPIAYRKPDMEKAERKASFWKDF